jgi:hypothetical protein
MDMSKGAGKGKAKQPHRTATPYQEVGEQGAQSEQGPGLLLVRAVTRELLGKRGALLGGGQHGLVGQLGDGRGAPLLNGHVQLLGNNERRGGKRGH